MAERSEQGLNLPADADGGLIVAARIEDVGPNELVPPADVPADLVIPVGYVARRLLPFSKPPSIATRLIH